MRDEPMPVPRKYLDHVDVGLVDKRIHCDAVFDQLLGLEPVQLILQRRHVHRGTFVYPHRTVDNARRSFCVFTISINVGADPDNYFK